MTRLSMGHHKRLDFDAITQKPENKKKYAFQIINDDPGMLSRYEQMGFKLWSGGSGKGDKFNGENPGKAGEMSEVSNRNFNSQNSCPAGQGKTALLVYMPKKRWEEYRKEKQSIASQQLSAAGHNAAQSGAASIGKSVDAAQGRGFDSFSVTKAGVNQVPST